MQLPHDHHCAWRDHAEAIERRLGEIIARQQKLIEEQQRIIEQQATQIAQLELQARQIDELQILLKDLNRLRRRARRLDPAACDPRRVCDVLLDGPTAG